MKVRAMRTMQEQLQALMARPADKPLDLEVTDWFWDVPREEVQAKIREFRDKFIPKRAELVEILGQPTRALPHDRDWFDQWYPESLEAAAWERGDTLICLAVDHHDSECPVALVLRWLPKSDLADLSADPNTGN